MVARTGVACTSSWSGTGGVQTPYELCELCSHRAILSVWIAARRSNPISLTFVTDAKGTNVTGHGQTSSALSGREAAPAAVVESATWNGLGDRSDSSATTYTMKFQRHRFYTGKLPIEAEWLEADLCDRDRLRVLEAAVEQLKERVEA